MTQRTPSPEQPHQPPDPRMLVALLADPARLRVFAALVLAPEPGGADAAGPAESGAVEAPRTETGQVEAGAAEPGPADLAAIARAAGVPVRDAAKILSRLEAAGLAAQEPGRGWHAVPETLRVATVALAHQREQEDVPGIDGASPQAAAVLRNFFSKGRLTHIPPAFGKRMVVLDFIAQSFDPGVRYPEPSVNEILLRFHDDYAALRRYLVDAGFLSRSESLYWRSGGSVDI
jgi:hypothetical protein